MSAKATELIVTRLDGSQLSGDLAAWDATKLTLSSSTDEMVTIAAADLLRMHWEQTNVAIEHTLIELVDGTRLPQTAYEVESAQAMVTTTLAEKPLLLPTKQIRWVQLAAAAPWETLAEQVTADDLLMIRKKSGTLDYLNGVLGSISPAQIEFTWDGEAMGVKRSKVAGLAYYHARQSPTQAPVCWLDLRSGGRLPVAEITFHQERVQVTTISGLALTFPVEEIREADYSQGKLIYLSDLQPTRQQWTPRINLPVAAALIRQHGLPRRDLSFTGSALTLFFPAPHSGAAEGQLKNYSKGLALRSRTELHYRRPKGMQRFITLAGIDPETANQGSVELEVFADRNLIWQGEINGGRAPTEIEVALGTARELRLVVDYGANLDFGDRLHLIEARLSQ